MKKFIPVNNNIDKAIAFAPSLDNSYFRKHRIQMPSGYINPVESLNILQKEGWEIHGVYENKNRDLKATKTHIQLLHPDLIMGEKGYTEGNSTLIISNSLTKQDMEMFLGFYRVICSNGLIAKEGEHYRIKKEDQLLKQLELIEHDSQLLINSFQRLKTIELNKDLQRELAKQALSCRFSGGVDIDSMQLLQAHRPQDEGDSVWKVFNRMQENLIKPNMLKDKRGMSISGVFDVDTNVRVNTQLYNEVVKPYLI